MHQEQRDRAGAWLHTAGLECALFANFSTVKWLTGFAPDSLSNFAGGPFLVWWDGETFTLVVLDTYEQAAAKIAQRSPAMRARSYLGYTVDSPIAPSAYLAETLRQTLKPAHSARRIGVEYNALTGLLLETLRTTLPQADLVAIDNAFQPLQMEKTAEELAKLRRAFALSDVGHQASQTAMAAGQREIDLWSVVRAAVNAAAGAEVPLGNDCAVGYRPFNVGGAAGDWLIRPQDSLILDLSACVEGYWGDSCQTLYAGEITPKQAELRKVAAEALAFAESLLRPGAVAQVIDQAVRHFIGQRGYPVYTHHTGHSVGLSIHEPPRLVPYETTSLRPNMVIMLEPGIYFPGETGVRLENAYRITETGAERLTNHLA
jgi:Xaa-Pro dipeptidase